MSPSCVFAEHQGVGSAFSTVDRIDVWRFVETLDVPMTLLNVV